MRSPAPGYRPAAPDRLWVADYTYVLAWAGMVCVTVGPASARQRHHHECPRQQKRAEREPVPRPFCSSVLPVAPLERGYRNGVVPMIWAVCRTAVSRWCMPCGVLVAAHTVAMGSPPRSGNGAAAHHRPRMYPGLGWGDWVPAAVWAARRQLAVAGLD